MNGKIIPKISTQRIAKGAQTITISDTRLPSIEFVPTDLEKDVAPRRTIPIRPIVVRIHFRIECQTRQ